MYYYCTTEDYGGLGLGPQVTILCTTKVTATPGLLRALCATRIHLSYFCMCSVKTLPSNN